jgi:hypothetical protein
MRPARIITAVAFAAAVAVTGFAAHSAVQPSPAPSPPVVDQAPLPVGDDPAPAPTPAPTPAPVPRITVDRVPVLADGRHPVYIRTVDGSRDRLVVDLVQVFHDQAAVTAAIADGKPRDTARYLSTYVRNQNPRLRTLPLAADLRVDLREPCGDPPSRGVLLARLASDAHRVGWYFVLTVSDGAVQQIEERFAGNAC